MAHDVDQALREWATRATDEELDAGPTLADLGGAAAVADQGDEIATGAQLPYLLAAVARDLASLPDKHATPLLAAVARGLREPSAAWTLAEALDVLCAHPALVARLGTRTSRDLVAHAQAALAGEADSALAQPAIAGLLRLVIAEQANRHHLLLLLTEITGGEPPQALERLPILIGIAHDHLTDTAELLTVLSTLENHPELSPATRADAGFELALADERAALQATDYTAAEERLRRALMRFKDLDRTHENRLDARAHAAAIEAVLIFAELAHDPPPSEASNYLTSVADRLAVTTAHLAAWSGRMHQLPWLSARGLTQSAWSRLVTTMQTASAHLSQPSWYYPDAALNDLLKIYQASRSVHAHLDQHHGLKVLISPALEASFIRHQGLLHHLQQALTTDPQLTDHPDARALYEAVQERQHRSTTAHQEAVPGKALTGRPALAALFHADTAALRDDLDPHLLDQLEQHIQQANKGYTPTGNHRLDAHLEFLLDFLATSPAWKPSDSHHFTTLLEQFLRFLYDRFDAQADLYGTRTAYLGPPPDTRKPWPEKSVQDDFHQHLAGTLTPGTIQREIIDVASGRTDITYTPQPGSRFVAEIKRRTTAWNRDTLERDYLAQATNYTATGPPFGLLLVGDHSKHQGGYPDIDDSIWVTRHARSPTEIPRFIVVGILPIGRATPSALRR
ncbi:hypothetical protein ACFY4C_39590 [Actinomadura viridis]|uniref:hypothetical protein n=1 Tax=Actinomadura viridis TaxID=58110 RepID=UPI0036AA9253